MISEEMIKTLEGLAQEDRDLADQYRQYQGRQARAITKGSDERADAHALVAEFGRLLLTDARLRDALAEARDRRAAMHEAVNEIQNLTMAMDKPCADCGEPALTMIDGRPVCEPCFDVANAVNLVPVEPDADFLMLGALLNGTPADEGADEPDLAPSDAQDDEAGEVSDER